MDPYLAVILAFLAVAFVGTVFSVASTVLRPDYTPFPETQEASDALRARAAWAAAETGSLPPLPDGGCPMCDRVGEVYWNTTPDPAQEQRAECGVCYGTGVTGSCDDCRGTGITGPADADCTRCQGSGVAA